MYGQHPLTKCTELVKSSKQFDLFIFQNSESQKVLIHESSLDNIAQFLKLTNLFGKLW